jgi:hypothetical protein
MPRALADGKSYHRLRMVALDTVVALSLLATDSKRHSHDVFGELENAGYDAKAVAWNPLEIRTSLRELGTVVGRRRRPADVRRELAYVAATKDPDHAPLITWTEEGRAVAVTISAHWHSAARGGIAGGIQIVPAAYAGLPPVERRAYVWLAGWAGIHGPKGKPRSIKLDTLASRLWPDRPLTPAAARQRRRRTKVALDRLSRLPEHRWIFEARADAVWVPARGTRAEASASALVVAAVPAAPTVHREPVEPEWMPTGAEWEPEEPVEPAEPEWMAVEPDEPEWEPTGAEWMEAF